MRVTCACTAPRQRMTAMPSRCRCMKRPAASATATAEISTASSATSARKRCARSRVRRTSGRPDSSVASFWPRCRCWPSHCP
ncbi:Uncharacterised protein [Bordetella pertussis]|nr:Uncharacterised protein [Bordetella pertussis]